MHRDDRSEHGSTLLLAPVMFLILLMLAGITVDWSSAFLAKREALNAADAAANDATAAAIDAATFQDDDTIVLDGSVAQRVALESLRRRLSSIKDLRATATVVDDPPGVTVVVTGSINTLFSRAFPFGRRTISISATGSAVAIQD